MRVCGLTAVCALCVSCGGSPAPPEPTIPSPVPSVAAASCCTISGSVTASGAAVARALVDLVGTGQPGHYTFTQDDGSFRLTGVPKGAVALRTGKWGFKTQVVNLVVDGDFNRTFVLQPGDPPHPLAFETKESSSVALDDTICATSDPGVENGEGGLGLVGPCKTYLLDVPQDATLVATATWPAPTMYMTLVTALHGQCCSSPLTIRFPVSAGSIVELGVSIHASDMLPLGTSAPFDLKVSLER